MYGHWQMGHMAPEQYTIKHNLFADAMRAVDPSIYIVAPGGFVDEMTTGQGIFIAGQPEVKKSILNATGPIVCSKAAGEI